jgi:predicted nucleic acid-binding protein
MHLIDTNYLVRLAVFDNSGQQQIVKDFLKSCKEKQEPVLVSIVSSFELVWVLKKFYKWGEKDVVSFLEKLYLSTLVEFENSELLALAITNSQNNSLGIEDNYNLMLAKQNNLKLHTFDQKLASSWGKLKK